MKVHVQKGTIMPHQESYRTKTHSEKVNEAVDNSKLRRSGQTMDKTFEPKVKKR